MKVVKSTDSVVRVVVKTRRQGVGGGGHTMLINLCDGVVEAKEVKEINLSIKIQESGRY